MVVLAEEAVAEMSRKVRVLCAVMTHPGNHEKKARHVRDTWGKRCDVLLFMSSVEGKTRSVTFLHIGNVEINDWCKIIPSIARIVKRDTKAEQNSVPMELSIRFEHEPDST